MSCFGSQGDRGPKGLKGLKGAAGFKVNSPPPESGFHHHVFNWKNGNPLVDLRKFLWIYMQFAVQVVQLYR